ncbi:hypothetical protein [Flavobacterium sp. UBA6135]|uniref:hypothetical protein n=1 Tax=Flavobacterium sp. UBA6135 TaxID=1946553 RepID=UPI0025C05D51|nr:hypothetical protein [Flavobacterium sp. UBA6135]
MKTLWLSLFLSILLLTTFNSCSSSDEEGCGKVSNVTVYSIGPTYLSFNFQTVNGVNSYMIEYGMAGFTKGTGTSFPTSQSGATIENLNPSTLYDIYITSLCDQGQTNFYKISNIATEQSQCTGLVSATLNQWYSTQNIDVYFEYSDGNVSKYEVEYGLLGFALGNGTKLTFNSNSGTIQGIQTNTTYDIYVRAICFQNDKSEAKKYTYTTIGSCPKPIFLSTTLIAGSCTQGTAYRNFSWNYDYSNAQSFTISLVSQGGLPQNGNQFTTSNESIAFSNMFCSWNQFYVRANCSDGSTSEWAGPINF